MTYSINTLKTTVSGLVLVASTLFTGNAYAQWCTGNDFSCWGTTQARQEIEDAANRGQNSGGGSAPVYVQTLPSKYGAVAFDSKTSTYGYSSAQKSARLAKLKALEDCGLSACKITSTYANQCAALAWGSTSNSGWWFFEPNPNLEVAKNKALAECQSNGGSCQIIMAECSLP